MATTTVRPKVPLAVMQAARSELSSVLGWDPDMSRTTVVALRHLVKSIRANEFTLPPHQEQQSP